MKIKFEYKEITDEVINIIEEFKKNDIVEEEKFNTIIAIGGDGTLFYSIKKHKNIRNFILINTGTLGFYNSCEKENIKNLIEAIKMNKLITIRLNLLNLVVETINNKYSFFTLNDVMLRSINYKSTYFKLFINNKKIEDIVGDGVLVSTSYGSSAYNLSLGGPIFVEDDLISITPVNPIRNKNYNILPNSILISKNNSIEIKPFNKTKDIILVNDGINYKIADLKRIYINDKDRIINIKSYKKIDFIDKIIDKII